MSGISGWPSAKKIISTFKNLTSSQSKTNSNYVTVQDMGCDKVGIDTTTKFLTRLHVGAKVVVSADNRIIEIASHGAEVGDVLKFEDGALTAREFPITAIISASKVLLGTYLDILPTAGDKVFVCRYITQRCSTDGSQIVSISQGPTIFTLNGADQTVIKDTVTPSNNKPFPTELIDTTGVVNVRALLTAIDTELKLKADLTETQPISATALPLPTGAATQTTLASLLTELQLKADLTETQPVSMVNLRVVDQIDSTPLLDTSSTNITASTGNPVTMVASSAAVIKKIVSVEDIGEFFGIYTGVALSEVLLCVLPLGGGEIEVNIPIATRISIRHMKNTAITSGYIALNFLG
jgi:hypothetical protein